MWGKTNALLVIFYVCLTGTSCQTTTDTIIKMVMKSFLKSGELPPSVSSMIAEVKISDMLKKGVGTVQLSRQTTDFFCSTCAILMDELYIYYNNPEVDNELFFDRFSTICTTIAGERLCNDAMQKYKTIFAYIFDNAKIVGEDICGMMLMQIGCRSTHDQREWKIELPDTPKPPIEKTPYPKISEVPTYKILFLNDIHYDRKYTTGSNADCDDINLCCHSDSGGNRTTGDEAGYWGDYRICDLPKRTIELLLKDASERHPDVEFIVWLGDDIAHDISGVTKEDVLSVINEMSDLIVQYFPNKLVLPVIGNHDVDPVNMFSPPYIEDSELSTSWLYNELAETWQTWLPRDVVQMVGYGGYYSTTIKPGLKAISINSNYCYSYNWWLILDSKDVAQNLEFLVKELQKVEDAGEKAYVLSHISPGSTDCDYTWSREFNKIINRYENVVSGIFHGHSHNDLFEIYFDSKDATRPYAVGYTAPSMTTYVGLNPGYKIHIVEGDFPGSEFRVLDEESYYLDLEAANTQSNTEITKLYSALEDYQLPDMSPESMLIFVKCMNLSDNSFFEDFFINYHRNGSNVKENCNDSCREVILSKLLHSNHYNLSYSELLKEPIAMLNMRLPTAQVRCGEKCYKNCGDEKTEIEKTQSSVNSTMDLESIEETKSELSENTVSIEQESNLNYSEDASEDVSEGLDINAESKVEPDEKPIEEGTKLTIVELNEESNGQNKSVEYVIPDSVPDSVPHSNEIASRANCMICRESQSGTIIRATLVILCISFLQQ